MIKLEFTQDELLILDKALGNLPYKEVVALIHSINNQLAQENKPAED